MGDPDLYGAVAIRKTDTSYCKIVLHFILYLVWVTLIAAALLDCYGYVYALERNVLGVTRNIRYNL